MALEPGDFLSWYNGEISRYRDHEWQLTSYSIGLSSAVVLFAKGADTGSYIAPIAAALTLGIFIITLVIAEIHTHLRLNEYRQRRDLLLKADNHRSEIKIPLVSGVLDAAYFGGFVLLPVFFGLAAMRVLLGS